MKINFSIVKKEQALVIHIPRVWEDLPCAQIEECLRECGGPQLDEVEGGIGYLVQTPEPWTKDELDFLRGIAEKKEKI